MGIIFLTFLLQRNKQEKIVQNGFSLQINPLNV